MFVLVAPWRVLCWEEEEYNNVEWAVIGLPVTYVKGKHHDKKHIQFLGEEEKDGGFGENELVGLLLWQLKDLLKWVNKLC